MPAEWPSRHSSIIQPLFSLMLPKHRDPPTRKSLCSCALCLKGLRLSAVENYVCPEHFISHLRTLFASRFRAEWSETSEGDPVQNALPALCLNDKCVPLVCWTALRHGPVSTFLPQQREENPFTGSSHPSFPNANYRRISSFSNSNFSRWLIKKRKDSRLLLSTTPYPSSGISPPDTSILIGTRDKEIKPQPPTPSPVYNYEVFGVCVCVHFIVQAYTESNCLAIKLRKVGRFPATKA